MNDLDTARRSPLQRAVGARYDAWHSLLVRAVHPICFGVFTLLSVAISAGILAIALQFDDSDALGYALVGVVAFGSCVVAAFTFVLTRTRAWIALALLAGWTIALVVREDVPSWIVWTIWIIAALSVVLQMALLAWVLPRRWRAGLLHLMWPAAVGTALGAIPVVVGTGVLLDGSRAEALTIARVSFVAAAVVLAVMLVLHEITRHDDGAVLRGWALRRSLGRRIDADEDSDLLTQRLVRKWIYTAGPFEGKSDGRKLGAATGFTNSRSPDVPSLHLTMLSIDVHAYSARDLWIRRRSWTHDNLLVSSSHAEVSSFESIALAEGWSIRFAPGTSELDAFVTIGPQVIELLERDLGAAQVCRLDGVMHGWIVGGAVSADELDRLAELMVRLAALLERADATIAADAPRTPEPGPTRAG